MNRLIAPRDRTITIPDGIPELTLGWEAIHWASKYLKQPDGERTGDRWEFIESQVRFILWWYALDTRGRWLFYHGVRRYPKGAGKSPFAAVMSLIELLAPVRLDHFDNRVLGGCVGRPVGMPLVQIAATSHDQANVNTMRMVRALLPSKSRIRSDYDVETGKTVFHTPGGGQLMVITSSPVSEEGALVTFAIMDQTETWFPTNGGVELSEVLDRNVGKSGSRLLETSNGPTGSTPPSKPISVQSPNRRNSAPATASGPLSVERWTLWVQARSLSLNAAISHCQLALPRNAQLHSRSSPAGAVGSFGYRDRLR